MERRLKRPLAITLAAIIVIVGSFVAFRFLGASQVPKEFKDARAEGGVISERIVQNAQSVAQSLNDVSTLENQKKYDEENAKIEELRGQNQSMKDDAIALSNQMQIMLKYIPDIRSEKARTVAFQAVNNELALIADLLSYGDYMEKLFAVIQDHTLKNRSAQIQGWLHEINNEVQQINDINTKAQEAFSEFDSITK
jgi:Cu/Ag efflux pump CusA